MRTLAFSARAVALAGIVMLVCQTASARVQHRTAMGIYDHPRWQTHADWIRSNDWIRLRAMPMRFAFSPGGGQNVHLSAYVPEILPPFSAEPALSEAAWRVSEVAARHGDRDYLMVDKSRGELIQFTNGFPAFIDHALTGASLADRLPPGALSKSYAEQYDVKYRVTPAGRFTVSHAFDHLYGATLDINEIKGKDWTIAIHSIASASRGARLRSPLDQDKHITEGCINVGADTMRRLAGLPARQGRIPLYILPMDEGLIAELF